MVSHISNRRLADLSRRKCKYITCRGIPAVRSGSVVGTGLVVVEVLGVMPTAVLWLLVVDGIGRGLLRLRCLSLCLLMNRARGAGLLLQMRCLTLWWWLLMWVVMVLHRPGQ